MKTKIQNASIVGITATLLEGLLIFLTDPTVDHWLLIQSLLFWFSCGFVVNLLEVGLPKFLSCILLTIFLNLPWFIALSIRGNKYEFFLPLFISSVVMGSIIGWTSIKLRKREEKVIMINNKNSNRTSSL